MGLYPSVPYEPQIQISIGARGCRMLPTRCTSISSSRCSTTLVHFAQRSNALCSAWHQMQCTPFVENAEWCPPGCTAGGSGGARRWSSSPLLLHSCPPGSHAAALLSTFLRSCTTNSCFPATLSPSSVLSTTLWFNRGMCPKIQFTLL